MNDVTRHAEPETLAAFADGRLDAGARAVLLAHLAVCAQCTHEVSLGMDALDEEAPPRPRAHRRFWMMAAAAAVAIAVLIPAARSILRRSPLATLVAAAPRSARVVEPRLSGGFPWARYAGPERADDGAVDPEQLQLAGAAGDVVARARRDASPEARHAAGVAMILIDKPAEGVAALECVAKSDGDARTWSDLAAARYAAATRLGRTSLLPQALAAADTALRLDPKMPEALFNRALILEKLGLTREAREAWQRYLAADPASEWANEARARLARLPALTRGSEFQRDQSLLERAAAAGDARRVRELTARYPQQARTFAEVEYLGRWAEAARRADRDAERWLQVARSIGAALVEISGESLLHDAVRAIDGDRDTLIAAHLAYRRGRLAHNRADAAEAERELRHAASLFAAARSPMALMARYYAASARLARNDHDGARLELERALMEADALPRFIAHGAHVRWELARVHMIASDVSGALPLLDEGAERFRRLGERANEAFLESMRARALAALGRFDEAWNARIRTFAALSGEGHSDMLASSITGAVQRELRAGRHDAALALASIEIEGARPVLMIASLIQRAMLEATAGGDALPVVARAEALAREVPDAALRERLLADVAVARGAATSDAAALSGAIEFYRAHGVVPALAEPLLLRARVAARRGDTAAALRDLDEGIAVVERHGEQSHGSGVLHLERALFTDAIALALQREETARAFAYAERLRGGNVTVGALQQRLAASQTIVLHVTALPSEIVTFVVSASRVAVARRGRDLPLYEQVIAPAESVLETARRVVIVADASLEHVAFAALYDARRRQHLVERFEVAMATNASSLRPGGAEPVRSAVAMALPSGETSQSRALPETDGELADVAGVYASGARVPRATLAAVRDVDADVLHIAGHTARADGAGEQTLVFADGRASSMSITRLAPLRARLVVLAACETLRRPHAAETRATTLGAAFLAAGAAEVVGTLTPIADGDARALFASFHRHLASGATPSAALRAAQLEALRRGETSWKSLALLTTSV